MQKSQKNIEPMKSLINVLVTFLMDCDKVNDTDFFETFCELNFMEVLHKRFFYLSLTIMRCVRDQCVYSDNALKG